MPDSAEAVPMFELSAGPGHPIGKRLTLLESSATRAVFLQSTPIHLYASDDKEAEAACMATLSRAGLASDVDIAAAFGVHRNTVGRLVRRFEGQGLAAVVPAKRGPKGPSKVTPEVLAIIEAHAELPRKELRERIERATGVSLSLPYVSELAGAHRATQQVLAVGTAREGSSPAAPPPGLDATAADDEDDHDHDTDSAGADDAGEVDDATGSGVVLLADEPVFDPQPVLPIEVSGRHVGLALYYPALGATGLVEAARLLYRLPHSVRFGVVATTVTLFFMTVVSKTTLEAAKHLRRVEFGAMAGSGFAPCVKTLRRKLKDLVDQGQAAVFGTTLARHWVDSGLVGTAYLYVDGHMKVYSGKKRLQEVWNSQRRMPLPGIHTYFVGDAEGRPLLFVSEELSPNLAKAMPRLVEAIREVVGDRRFCVIFDRGGYDGKLFSWLQAEHIDFVTYQRGSVALPAESFARRQTRFEGRRRRFFIAEDTAKVGRSGPWRRIVVRSKDGHQSPILTNIGAHVGAARIAALMFSRWRQENFFKYMGEHRGLDDITSYATVPADADNLVPNPARKALDRRIAEARKRLVALRAELGGVLLDEPREGRSAHGLKVAQGGKVGQLRDLEAEIETLVAERKALPTHVALGDAGVRRDVTRREAKAIVDRIKICAYNAEEWLLDRLVMHYRNAHDVRDLLRSFAELSGTITTTAAGVLVRLDPPDTPIHRRALHGLIADLNAVGTTFPGTEIPVTYEVSAHHADLVA